MDTQAREMQIWFVLGAGLSIAEPSRIPLWGEIKEATISELMDSLVYYDQEIWKNGDRYPFVELRSNLNELLPLPEQAMELLSRAYRKDLIERRIVEIISRPDNPPKPNAGHKAIAHLCMANRVAGIITTNFDTMMENALDAVGLSYHVVLDIPQLHTERSLPIYKLHGSISIPNSMRFLRQDYHRGIPSDLWDHLVSKVRNATIYIIGYSGNDADVYPLIQEFVLKKEADNQTFVVDISSREANSRLSNLCEPTTYIQCGAQEFLCKLAQDQSTQIPEGGRSAAPCSLVPHNDPFNSVLFIGEAMLSLGKEPYPVFFLAQDIADDRNDAYCQAIAHLAKSIGLFLRDENEMGMQEYSIGHAYLSRIGLEDAAYTQWENYTDHVLLWFIRAKGALAYAAIGTAQNTSNPSIRDEMIEISRKPWHGMKNWQNQYYGDKRNSDIASIPSILYELLEGYRQ